MLSDETVPALFSNLEEMFFVSENTNLSDFHQILIVFLNVDYQVELLLAVLSATALTPSHRINCLRRPSYTRSLVKLVEMDVAEMLDLVHLTHNATNLCPNPIFCQNCTD